MMISAQTPPNQNAADPPVAVGERGALSQVSSGQQSPQVKPGGSADLIVSLHNEYQFEL